MSDAKAKFAKLQQAAKDPKLREELDFILNEFVKGLIYDALKEGTLKVHGKNKEDTSRAILRHIRKAANRGVILITDMRSSLLEAAKKLSKGNPVFAAIFLATYFEHWINDLILAACARKRIQRRIAHRLIRSTPFVEKAGILFEELDMPAPPKSATSAICMVSKIRNDFIHYRWEAMKDDDHRRHEKKVADTVKRGFQAVANLGKYERETFLKGLDILEKHSRDANPSLPADYWIPGWTSSNTKRASKTGNTSGLHS